MRNLIEFLSRNNHWFVFLILEALSFVLLFQYNSYQGSVWFSSANAVTGKIYEWSSAVEQYFTLTETNRQLTDRNLQLERELSAVSAALTHQKKDTSYVEKLQMKAVATYRMIPAKVVSNSVDKIDNFITIDKGSADGIKKDMGVVSGMGVVGIVYLVSEHYSVVIPVLNSHSNISCTIRGRGYFGYLHWNGGAVDEAYVDDIPRHARFRTGDWVVTSGYSQVFPPGVIVGRIYRVYNSENGLSYRLRLKLSTDFGRLRDVSVVDDAVLIERQKLIQAAQDSIKPRE